MLCHKYASQRVLQRGAMKWGHYPQQVSVDSWLLRANSFLWLGLLGKLVIYLGTLQE